MDYVEHRMAHEAARETASTALLTPLNLILASLVLYAIYAMWMRPSAAASSFTLTPPPPPTVFKTYTPRTLLPFDGNGPDGRVFLAVRGQVFDVSNGRNFYGPGGPYANFAGRDASRGLACGSFDEDMLTKDLDGPLDTLEDLSPDELDAMRGWEERFSEKYQIVGRLVSAADFAGSGKK